MKSHVLMDILLKIIIIIIIIFKVRISGMDKLWNAEQFLKPKLELVESSSILSVCASL